MPAKNPAAKIFEPRRHTNGPRRGCRRSRRLWSAAGSAAPRRFRQQGGVRKAPRQPLPGERNSVSGYVLSENPQRIPPPAESCGNADRLGCESNNWPIPRRLCPSAQGWWASAYLGSTPIKSSTATRLWRIWRALNGREWPQPRCGWQWSADDDPGYDGE